MTKTKVVTVRVGQGQGVHGQDKGGCGLLVVAKPKVVMSPPNSDCHQPTLAMAQAHQSHISGSSARARLFPSSYILGAHKFYFKDDKLPLFLEKEQTPRFYSWKKPQLPVSIRAGPLWLPRPHTVGDTQNWDIPALPHPCRPQESQATQAEDEIPAIQTYGSDTRLSSHREINIFFFPMTRC